MSVRSTTYLIWGVSLPYDKVTYEQVEERLAEDMPNGMVGVIYDGMCGKFVYVGVIHARTGDDDGGFDEPVVVPMIHTTADMFSDPENLMLFTQRRNAITEALRLMGLEVMSLGKPIQWHVVTHCR